MEESSSKANSSKLATKVMRLEPPKPDQNPKPRRRKPSDLTVEKQLHNIKITSFLCPKRDPNPKESHLQPLPHPAMPACNTPSTPPQNPNNPNIPENKTPANSKGNLTSSEKSEKQAIINKIQNTKPENKNKLIKIDGPEAKNKNNNKINTIEDKLLNKNEEP